MINESNIIPPSNIPLWMIFMPNSGRLVRNKGSKAQCIAQASDAPIPSISQSTFQPMMPKLIKSNTVAK
jgi:hypothetical protein